MNPLDNLMKTSVKSRFCDVNSIRVLKDMEPRMIYDSNMTAASLRKRNQLEEEKFKLLKKNLILELEVRHLEVQREKVKKSHRWEEELEQLEEDNNDVNEEEDV